MSPHFDGRGDVDVPERDDADSGVVHDATTSTESAVAVSVTLRIENLVSEPSYVVGMPVFVAFDLRASPPGSSVVLASNDWTAPPVDISLSMYDSQGLPVDTSPPRSAQERERVSVRDDAPVRWLVDLSTLLPTALVPGHYTVQLRVHNALSETMQWDFVAPSSRERAALALRSRSRAQTWFESLLTAHATPPNHVGPQDPLRFFWIVLEVLRGPRNLARFDLTRLGVLTGVYAAEGDAIRAELLTARGDATALNALRSVWPGLRSRADAMGRGEGVYSLLRTSLGAR